MRHFIWILCCIVVITLAAILYVDFPTENDSHSPINVHLQKGKHFTLTGHTGETYDSDNHIREGDYALIFFGFTHCPVICPTELQKFAQVMDLLPKETAAKIQPLFITIDPDRDTVEALAQYMPLFHPAILGLTGEVADIHRVLDDWKVYYKKIDNPDYSSYTMDHSTYAYVVDHTMAVRALFRMRTNAKDIAAEISRIVAVNN